MANYKYQGNYDEDYFENGLVSGKSCYLNYRWLPELTFRMAFHIVRELNIYPEQKILDFGCAKGYLVKALRHFDIECYGCDISEYAIAKSDADIAKFCKLNNGEEMIPFDLIFDWIICKDVAEHFEESELESFLQQAAKKSKKIFFIIPLGKNGKFIAPEYEKDITHKLIKDEDWWSKKFAENSWKVENIQHNFKGLKENWVAKYPKSNGFFILNNTKEL